MLSLKTLSVFQKGQIFQEAAHTKAVSIPVDFSIYFHFLFTMLVCLIVALRVSNFTNACVAITTFTG